MKPVSPVRISPRAYASGNCFGLMLSCLIFVIGASISTNAYSQEFRIESQVYAGTSKLPVSQNVTLFSGGIVYDFQMSNEAQPKPVELVIFDSRNQMMILLDPKREVQLELPELRLIKILDSVRKATLQDERTKFLVQDTFSEDNNDWESGWVTLESPQITYRFKGAYPQDATILPQYFQFLENFTRLNATDPTKIPPFARIKLNTSIKRLGWIPSEVQISVRQNALFKKAFSAKSKHVVVNQLSDKDKQRIASAKAMWLNFKAVDLGEYRGLKAQAPLAKMRSALSPDKDSKVKAASYAESVLPEQTSTKGK